VSSQANSLLNQGNSSGATASGTVGLKAGNTQPAGQGAPVNAVQPLPGPWRNPSYRLKDGSAISIGEYRGRNNPKMGLSYAKLDFDYNNNSPKGTFGILQQVTKDTFQPLLRTPYADPVNGPKYYDDTYSSYLRKDPLASKSFNAYTGKMTMGSSSFASNEDYVLRHQDVPQNPYDKAGRYGELNLQTQIVRREGDVPVATIYWGYANTLYGYRLNQLIVTEP
jgi:hypothetical protein